MCKTTWDIFNKLMTINFFNWIEKTNVFEHGNRIPKCVNCYFNLYCIHNTHIHQKHQKSEKLSGEMSNRIQTSKTSKWKAIIVLVFSIEFLFALLLVSLKGERHAIEASEDSLFKSCLLLKQNKKVHTDKMKRNETKQNTTFSTKCAKNPDLILTPFLIQ